MSKTRRIEPDSKYSTYSYLKPGGEGQQEVVTFVYPQCYTLDEIMHKIGLSLAMEQLKAKPRRGDLTVGELLDSLTPEMLAPYGANILRSSVEAISLDREATVIGRHEMNSFWAFYQNTQRRIRKMRDYAPRFARRLEKERANGHPIISTWNSLAISISAVEWADQFAWENDVDYQKFFKKKLEEAKPVVQNTPASEKPVA